MKIIWNCRGVKRSPEIDMDCIGTDYVIVIVSKFLNFLKLIT